MFDPVGSTSWPGRNRRALRRLAERLAAWPCDPVVILIGPGAVTRLMRPFLATADPESTGRTSGLSTDLARYVDQLVRRVPFLPLVSFEPLELAELMSRPCKLVVFDRSSRVLAAIRRDIPQSELHRGDIVATAPPVVGDAVIALNIVSRTPAPAAAMRNIAAAVKPGGLLAIDDRSAGQWLPASGATFEPLGDKLYRRA
jgi:SAM-dependent methyltransferase